MDRDRNQNDADTKTRRFGEISDFNICELYLGGDGAMTRDGDLALL